MRSTAISGRLMRMRNADAASIPASPRPPGADGESPRRGVAGPERKRRRPASRPREIGGPQGPEPTRFGDWERAGRCIDF
jgi:hypothetical protein